MQRSAPTPADRRPTTLRTRCVLASRGLLAVVGAGVLLVAGCSDDQALTTPDGSPISKSTTRVAEVNIVSPERDYTKTCLAPTTPDAGTADVDRIVVTDPALLDDVCALGLGSKVVAVAADAGSVPVYLGPQLTSVPTIGTSPDAAAVRTANADLILTTPDTESAAKDFGTTRTAVVTPSSEWRKQFTDVAEALGRSAAGAELLDEFATEARKTGRRMDASHSQVSLVRFTPDAELIEGTDNFAAQILATVGVQRPAPQRRPDAVTVTDDNFTDADADLIYVSFQGDRGQERGEDVLRSDRWLDMGAPTWKRVLAVNDDVWYQSSGLAAAWLVLNDIKGSLDGNSAGY